MEYLTIPFDEDIYRSNMLDFYFGGLKCGVLDIETTGLDPLRSRFILGGIFDAEKGCMHQVFADSRSEEKEALERFACEIDDLDMVITYNGRHFDMPFLQKRSLGTGRGDMYMPYDLDLYLVLNGHSPVRRFVPNLKQKTVEAYMGLWDRRTDEISGAESVELYDEYERSGDPSIRSKILLHNSDDVLQLTRLIKVVSKSDFHKAMFSLGFPVGNLTVDRIVFHRDVLTVTGTQRREPFEYAAYSYGRYPAQIRFIREEASFMMKLPVIRDKGLVIADLEAAGIDAQGFEKYPSFGSGFLVLADGSGINYLETNHFVKSFIEAFMTDIR